MEVEVSCGVVSDVSESESVSTVSVVTARAAAWARGERKNHGGGTVLANGEDAGFISAAELFVDAVLELETKDRGFCTIVETSLDNRPGKWTILSNADVAPVEMVDGTPPGVSVVSVVRDSCSTKAGVELEGYSSN